jgi:hypothetical protein
MALHTVFDAASTGFFPYTFVLAPLAFTVLGVWMSRRPDEAAVIFRATSPSYARLFGLLMASLSAFMVIFSLIGIHHRQSEIAREFAQRDYDVVSGRVSEFKPDLDGHSVERFRVGEAWFGYRGAVDAGGFHQRAADGGPIGNGRRVRMLVDHQGRILKLDVSQ